MDENARGEGHFIPAAAQQTVKGHDPPNENPEFFNGLFAVLGA